MACYTVPICDFIFWKWFSNCASGQHIFFSFSKFLAKVVKELSMVLFGVLGNGGHYD